MCGEKLHLHVLNAHTQAHREEDGRKLLEAMGTLMALIVVMVSPVHTDLQTH